MKLYTIGFTKKSAEKFFGLIGEAQVSTLVDVRLNNVSQLAGFAKRDDLVFFLQRICGVSYAHRLDLAPTQAMLDGYRKKRQTWDEYEQEFLKLIADRRVEAQVPRELIDNAVLLCSEDRPHHCHRRLVAEYFTNHWPDITISHLV